MQVLWKVKAQTDDTKCNSKGYWTTSKIRRPFPWKWCQHTEVKFNDLLQLWPMNRERRNLFKSFSVGSLLKKLNNKNAIKSVAVNVH